jgi:hypothetical protein
LIWSKVQGLRLLDTQRSSNRILEEIGKPAAWTEMLASRVPDVYDFGILHHGMKDHEKYPYGGTEEERNKVFDEQAKRNEPARTFTFKTEELLKI